MMQAQPVSLWHGTAVLFLVGMLQPAGAVLQADSSRGEQSVEVVVRVQGEIARGLRHHGQDLSEGQTLNDTVKAFGAQLEPLHPGVSDPELQRYFRITGVAPDQVDRLIESLRNLRGIEAAYQQPPMSAP